MQPESNLVMNQAGIRTFSSECSGVIGKSPRGVLPLFPVPVLPSVKA
jgi:hypothetical protein